MGSRTQRQHVLIGAYDSPVQVGEVVCAFDKSRYDMKKLSVVAKGHTDERAVGLYTTGDRMKTCGEPTGFWGELWEQLAGAALLWVPGIGPVAVAGAFTDKFVDAVEVAEVTGRASAVSAALVGLGLPTNRLVKYDSLLSGGKYLVLAHGTLEEVRRARQIMKPSSITGTEIVAA